MNDKIKDSRRNVGRLLQEQRVKLGYTHKDVAGKIGVSESTVKGIESGRFAWDIDLHIRLCEMLNINIYYPKPESNTQ